MINIRNWIRECGSTSLCLIIAFIVTLTLSFRSSIFAQEAKINDPTDGLAISDGAIAVTGFSGVVLPGGGLAPGVDPISLTQIDPDGGVLRLFNVSNLGGAAKGEKADLPPSLEIKSKDVGQVFGVTFDKPEQGRLPNIFVAATSLYGLHIVAERNGKLERLVKGAPDAQWMPGQFGASQGGGPGSIWKIDGNTGKASLFATIKSGPERNAGPGLGALTYDPVSKHIYVPNLETGHVHQVDMQGQTLALYDHGSQGRVQAKLEPIAHDVSKRMSIDHPNFDSEDPATWGFADQKRLVFAVAVHNGRLYYSVAEGQEIWSVGLDKGGSFSNDARRELSMSSLAVNALITGISFGSAKDLYVTQRGPIAASFDYGALAKPNQASVLHFKWNEESKSWTDAVNEFPVGLQPPHRATGGGLALGYGYDTDGKINLDACRATLWTTGDNLNKSNDVKTINGLQAMAISLSQERQPLSSNSQPSQATPIAPETLPELTAEAKSWFLDFDGQSLGNDAFGHVGGLAIYATRCEGDVGERNDVVASADPTRVEPKIDPAFAPIPGTEGDDGRGPAPGEGPSRGPTGDADGSDTPPPGTGGGDGGAPPATPGIAIAKTCDPAPIGGAVRCRITVTNTGTAPLSDAIVVTDESVVATGAAEGGSVRLTAVNPDTPDWTCTPVPTVSLQCSLQPQQLPPGTSRTFEVSIDTGAMLADGNVGFRNCATLGAPYSGQACDNGGTDISVRKFVLGNCTAGSACPVRIEITNNSSTDFNGPVQLTDVLVGTGPAAGVPIIPINPTNPPFGCAGGDFTQIPNTCASSISVAAGQTLTFNMSLNIPAAPDNYRIRNCFAVTQVGLIPSVTTMGEMLRGGPSGGTLGTGGAVGCDWLTVGNPPEERNLKVTKLPLGKCDKDAADPNLVRCNYQINITNTGPSLFNEPIDIKETFPVGGDLVSNSPQWDCNPAAPPVPGEEFCVSRAPMPIASNETIALPVSVVIPRAVVESSPAIDRCRVPNRAEIVVPLGSPSNYDTADDFDETTGDAFLLEFQDGGAVAVLCDPTNLELSKKSLGPCKKNTDGTWRCSFLVEVLNTGPDPYKGKIEIEDTFGNAYIKVDSYSGSHTWNKAGNTYRLLQEDLLPNGTLEVGSKVSLKIVADFPDGKFCSISNTAKLTFPVKYRYNTDKTDNVDMASASVPRPECKPVVHQCKPSDGEIRTKTGECACQRNHSRVDGKCVANAPEAAKLASLSVSKQCTEQEQSTFRCRITVQNNGSTVHNGRVTLIDATRSLTDGSPIVVNDVIPDVAGAWICGDAPATDLSCGIEGQNIRPGQSRHFDILVRLEGKHTGFRNCVEGLMENDTGNQSIGRMCVTGEIDPKLVGVAELEVSKSCRPTGIPNRFSCRIAVRNRGTAAHDGQLTLNDVTSDLANGSPIRVVQVNPDQRSDWNCRTIPPNTVDCAINGSGVGPGVTRYVNLVVSTRPGQSFKNCVEGLMAGSADVHSFGERCVQVNAAPLPLPSANLNSLTVSKIGLTKCVAGQNCVFVIRYTNNGKKPINGSVAIVDGVTGSNSSVVNGVEVISITPPLGCSQQPSRLPFGCQAKVNLKAGETRTHTIALRIPEKAVNADRTQMSNCVMVNTPDVLRADVKAIVPNTFAIQSSGTAGNRTACHSFAVQRQLQCSSNMLLDPQGTGTCVCPMGTRWSGRMCVTVDELACWTGWTKIAANEVKSYLAKDHRVQPRRRQNQTVWCAQLASQTETPPQVAPVPAPPAPPVTSPPPAAPPTAVAPSNYTTCKDGTQVTKGQACPTYDCPSNMTQVSYSEARRLRRRGSNTLRLKDGKWCAGAVPGPSCKQVWRNVCETRPEKKCERYTENECRTVTRPDCRTVTGQTCTVQPQRECRRVTRNQCRVVPNCRNVTNQVCRNVRRVVCRGTGEFRECKPQTQRVCQPRTRRVCTNRTVCKPQTTTRCTTRNKRVCRPTSRRVCSNKTQRVCTPRTKTRCTTVQRRRCTRKRETVCK